jgi:uncharacterized protein YndB with AHSA1/START domain
MTSSRASRLIHAPCEVAFRAFVTPELLRQWQAPGEMTARIHAFDVRVGGGYEMSLYYPETGAFPSGKTAEREDRFTVRFDEISPPERLVETVVFESGDPAFAGEMTMIVTLAERDGGTDVTIVFENIPEGIRPEDNDEGTRQSLEKLATLVEEPPAQDSRPSSR